LRDLEVSMDDLNKNKEKLQELAKDLDPFNPKSVEKWRETLLFFGFKNLDNPFELSREILNSLNKNDSL